MWATGSVYLICWHQLCQHLCFPLPEGALNPLHDRHDWSYLVATPGAYLGLDSQDDLRQGHDEALEGDGDILQHKVGNAHNPQQVEEVQRLQVGL